MPSLGVELSGPGKAQPDSLPRKAQLRCSICGRLLPESQRPHSGDKRHNHLECIVWPCRVPQISGVLSVFSLPGKAQLSAG
jgi:hypothetical protein